MLNIVKSIFGTRSQREVKRIMPIVEKINSLADTFAAMSDDELRGMTDKFKERFANGETLDDMLPEAFAAAREGATRALGLRPFDVQLIGGIILHQGRIAEMKTGEGKTLVATLPAYLNAISGNGVHIVTVNDYLAKRDSEWMGKFYRFMGLSVGLIVHDMTSEDRRAAYNADITYATNNELGFDYLRDNMALYKKNMVQRGHSFAIVDEVDSILIDEARTPLIISGIGDMSTSMYQDAERFASGLKCLKFKELDSKEENDNQDADYIVDEKEKSVTLTARGIAKAEQHFGVENLSDPENTTLLHHINQAIRAHGIMTRDIDYVVRDGQVIIVDEFTGRLMFGRRYNNGLHQAIEAKEHVKVEHESKTLATITFQNFFRLYTKLSGMTGTALTEQEEFQQIYSLDVIEIPTNKPVARKDNNDAVYKNEAGKHRAIIKKIIECHKKGQPVLVGTISIEKSELLSDLLKKQGIEHKVLNAKHHEKEAEIVAQAGQFGAVTIATNMAGRGTDIMLGGNAEYMAKKDLKKEGFSDYVINEATGFAETEDEEIIKARELYNEKYKAYKAETNEAAKKVIEAGGLFILGTERHESRRIDNQLRGRAGRQGDPGESMFFISLEDDLMRLFGSDRIISMMESLGFDEDTPIDQKMLSNAIESAQKKVESKNFQIRKHVLQFDDVMNKQREIIYGQRYKVLNGEDLSGYIASMAHGVIQNEVRAAVGENTEIEAEQAQQIIDNLGGVFFDKDSAEVSAETLHNMLPDEITEKICELADKKYAEKVEEWGEQTARELERVVLLRTVDKYWMDHIDAMDELRQGIVLRAYAQNDPVVEYKREGFDMFDQMIDSIREETVKTLFRAHIKKNDELQRQQVAVATGESGGGDAAPVTRTVSGKKHGRNDPCPCGSGKKYKKCCGKNS